MLGKEPQKPRLIHLPDKLVEQIDQAAIKAGDVSRSSYIRRVLTERLKQEEREEK